MRNERTVQERRRPLAAGTVLPSRLGEWVLQQACSHAQIALVFLLGLASCVGPPQASTSSERDWPPLDDVAAWMRLVSDQATANQATEVLGRRGREAEQIVRALLHSSDPAHRLAGLFVMRAPSCQLPELAGDVIACFDIYGTGIRGGILDEERVEFRMAVDALESIGDSALPSLKTGLQSASPKVRYGCVSALGRMGSIASSASDDLVALVRRERNQRIRLQAITTLGKIGVASSGAVELLAELGGSELEPVVVRAGALAAIGSLSGFDDRLLDALIDACEARSPEIVETALRALTEYAPRHDRSVSAFIRAIEDSDATICAIAVRGLASAGAKARRARSKLLDIARNDCVTSYSCRLSAIDALGNLTAKDREVLKVLLTLSVSQDLGISRQAIDALARGRDSVVAPLMEVVREGPPEEVGAVASALMRIRPVRPDVLKEVRSLLDRENSYVRRCAANALLTAGFPEGTLPVLADALRDPDPGTSEWATWVLLQALGGDAAIRSGDASAEVLGAVRSFLGANDVEVRRGAAFALLRAGYIDGTEPVVIQALTASDPESRAWAAWLLAGSGRTARPFLPVLERTAQDQDSEVRRAAEAALEAIRTSE